MPAGSEDTLETFWKRIPDSCKKDFDSDVSIHVRKVGIKEDILDENKNKKRVDLATNFVCSQVIPNADKDIKQWVGDWLEVMSFTRSLQKDSGTSKSSAYNMHVLHGLIMCQVRLHCALLACAQHVLHRASHVYEHHRALHHRVHIAIYNGMPDMQFLEQFPGKVDAFNELLRRFAERLVVYTYDGYDTKDTTAKPLSVKLGDLGTCMVTSQSPNEEEDDITCSGTKRSRQSKGLSMEYKALWALDKIAITIFALILSDCIHSKVVIGTLSTGAVAARVCSIH
jgi:hypothetical protein